MENIFFLILVAVIGLIRWLSQAAENKRSAETEKRDSPPSAPATSPPARRGAPQSEEERVRKFLEALGVPTTSSPPPKVQPRQVITPKTARTDRKFQPVDPFPVPRGRAIEPSPEPPYVAAPPPLPPISAPAVESPPLPTRETTVLAAPARLLATASEFEVQEIGAPEVATKSGTATATLAARLATRQGLREAIVLREIFGPPRSMQPSDHRAAAG